MINAALIFTPNPIVSREVRSRWRGRAWMYVFAYALFLAVVLVGFYYFIIADSSLPGTLEASEFRARGHTLFMAVSCLQIVAIMLIAPAQTATAIVSEREQGMLEAMQLTPLPPWRIIVGKLLSVFFFLMVMLLVPLPIIATSFMLGGVSPGEFCLVLLLQIATGATCAIIGLACSARCRRSGSALALAFFLTIGWLIFSYVAMILVQHYRPLLMPVAWIGPGGPPSAPATPLWIEFSLKILDYVVEFNPVFAIVSVLQPDVRQYLWLSGSAWPWATNLMMQTILSLLLLWLAIRAVRKPLPAPGELRRRPGKQLQATDRRRSTPIQEVGDDTTVRGAVLHEPVQVPMARLRFSNPVLQRELRARLQLRPVTTGFRFRIVLLVTAGAGGYLLLVNYLWNYVNDVYVEVWIVRAVAAMMLPAAAMGAMAFTREREGRTWEALRLSLLTPREIINGKAVAALMTCLIYSILLWPLAGVWYFGLIGPQRQHALARGTQIPPDTFLVLAASMISLLLVGLAAIWLSVACGMIFSWFHRSTPAAVGWTLTTLAVSSIVALFGPGSFAKYLPYDLTWSLMRLCHPAAALAHIHQSYQMVAIIFNGWGGNYGNFRIPFATSSPFEPWLQTIHSGLVSAVTIFLIGQLLLSIIQYDMKRKVGRDSSSG